ncbi:hypothetical protein DESAMIL20_345 [Desulfurella amilsii]|uniref:TPR repeat containing exported protein n=1 Tax=Desulfurella amilsii TaxID=1562698 RepID=A0A1X4XYW0_9BACT|nr:tetratricopeptide repeat protein [Desulfurella amilsii]OSS42725.1 TPR repeat containing exported protein [Desulfurella amilsii]OSS42801.1 hypothetical protein DESAMIL20_345 [Desulfurella amilsii]
MSKKLFLLFVLVLLSSCASNQQINNINDRLGKIESAISKNTSDLNKIKPKVSEVEEKLNILAKKINTLENNTNSTKKVKISQKTIVEANLDNNTNDITSKIPPASVVFSNETQEKLENKQIKETEEEKPKEAIESKLQPPSVEALKSYENALAIYMKRDFAGALDKFLQFLNNYPHTTLEQNAYFWIGNSYYNLNDYGKALNYFSVCLNNFSKKPTSDGGKTDACIFMLYKTYKSMGNTQKAYDCLMQLKREYPVNPYFEFRGVKN